MWLTRNNLSRDRPQESQPYQSEEYQTRMEVQALQFKTARKTGSSASCFAISSGRVSLS